MFNTVMSESVGPKLLSSIILSIRSYILILHASTFRLFSHLTSPIDDKKCILVTFSAGLVLFLIKLC